FVADRQILDGPFILDEVLQWCRRKKKHALIFKVDFEKAFDPVRWDFVDDVLNKLVSVQRWKDLDSEVHGVMGRNTAVGVRLHWYDMCLLVCCASESCSHMNAYVYSVSCVDVIDLSECEIHIEECKFGLDFYSDSIRNSKAFLRGYTMVCGGYVELVSQQASVLMYKIPEKALIFDNLVSSSFYWCKFRCKASFKWDDWLKNPYIVLV
ncbi:hypothetical protein Tco_1188900, partial [Tanacetum coccineum]